MRSAAPHTLPTSRRTYPKRLQQQRLRISCRGPLLRSDFEYSHHPMVLVVQDVTVKHPLSWIIVVPDDEARGLVPRHVDHILPAAIALGDTVPVEHLELKAVQVERVVHADEVLDLPDLGRA